MAKAANFRDIIDVSSIASNIGNMWSSWQSARSNWIDSKNELIRYVYATDTKATVSQSTPWRNSTTRPKLCQIADNLLVNYIDVLFPKEDWLVAEGTSSEGARKEVKDAYEAYAREVARKSDFRSVVDKLVYDYIIFGNCFAMPEYLSEKTTLDNGEIIYGYVGPRLQRIHPFDIVFDPTAESFDRTPKIIRSIKSIGELASDMEEDDSKGYLKEAFNKIMNDRSIMGRYDKREVDKDTMMVIEGFGNMQEYYTSSSIELLDFYGDFFDIEANKLYKNYIITVADRTTVIRKEPNPSWLGKAPIYHCGWRRRVDNLWAMGPLDNIQSMQYRIDHLENMRADVFDQIASPIYKIKGTGVQDFLGVPGERIHMDTDSDVEMMHPDVTVLNADNQIREYMNSMEEIAGAPREALGIRTPGEKTAFEVSTLTNSAQRVFISRSKNFETNMVEPAINALVELGRRNMQAEEMISIFDEELNFQKFLKITKEDLSTNVRVYPVGSRHYEAYATLIQNIIQLSNSAVGQDEAVKVHISGIKSAKLLEKALQLEKYGLVKENIRVMEMADTKQLSMTAQENAMTAYSTPSGMNESDMQPSDF